MPFDSAPQKARDRGYQLVYALRNLPEDWDWDFSEWTDDCGTTGCAIGLAHRMWPELELLKYDDFVNYEIIRDALGIDTNMVHLIFSSTGLYDANTLSEVRPHQVADELEKALDNAG